MRERSRPTSDWILIDNADSVRARLAWPTAQPSLEGMLQATMYAETGVWGKMLQLLREAKPDVKRVGILWT